MFVVNNEDAGPPAQVGHNTLLGTREQKSPGPLPEACRLFQLIEGEDPFTLRDISGEDWSVLTVLGGFVGCCHLDLRNGFAAGIAFIKEIGRASCRERV